MGGKRVTFTTNDKIGEWTVLSPFPFKVKNNPQHYFLVECKCSKVTLLKGATLRSKNSSCCRTCSRVMYTYDGSYNKKANNKYIVCRKSAETRGYCFELDYREWYELVYQPCYYCGVMSSPFNGLDRVDPDLGYTVGNVVPCCWVCNRAKATLSYQEFIKWIERAYQWTHAAENVRTANN